MAMIAFSILIVLLLLISAFLIYFNVTRLRKNQKLEELVKRKTSKKIGFGILALLLIVIVLSGIAIYFWENRVENDGILMNSSEKIKNAQKTLETIDFPSARTRKLLETFNDTIVEKIGTQTELKLAMKNLTDYRRSIDTEIYAYHKKYGKIIENLNLGEDCPQDEYDILGGYLNETKPKVIKVMSDVQLNVGKMSENLAIKANDFRVSKMNGSKAIIEKHIGNLTVEIVQVYKIVRNMENVIINFLNSSKYITMNKMLSEITFSIIIVISSILLTMIIITFIIKTKNWPYFVTTIFGYIGYLLIFIISIAVLICMIHLESITSNCQLDSINEDLEQFNKELNNYCPLENSSIFTMPEDNLHLSESILQNFKSEIIILETELTKIAEDGSKEISKAMGNKFEIRRKKRETNCQIAEKKTADLLFDIEVFMEKILDFEDLFRKEKRPNIMAKLNNIGGNMKSILNDTLENITVDVQLSIDNINKNIDSEEFKCSKIQVSFSRKNICGILLDHNLAVSKYSYFLFASLLLIAISSSISAFWAQSLYKNAE
ncbi:unnamed protein product [Caenorhabditis angaria]|uniref:Uncharacterized protein n=1 Tax=Caenorhabditis angaria TaxID=860376 RepID=A0A9P1N0F9_9PELO|nr:unnamed protein product [Caenorhabditis angaria]